MIANIDWWEPGHRGISWLGQADLEVVDQGLVPWRLPSSVVRDLPAGVAAACQASSGVRIRFRTDSPSVWLKVRNDEPESALGVVADGRCTTVAIVDDAARFDGFGGGTIELWLPNRGRTTVGSVGLVEGSSLEPVDPPRVRWLAYGSSITQGMNRGGPADTWPARVARGRDLDLMNLGLADEAHLDLAVARHLAATEASLITVCSGINVYLSASLSVRTYRQTLKEFIDTIRRGQPTTPIVVIGPIVSPRRELTPSYPRAVPRPIRRLMGRSARLKTADAMVGPTLSTIRDETEAAVATLVNRGDTNLRYCDGRRLLGEAEADLLVDGLHPGPEGDALMAERFQSLVVDHLLGPIPG